MKLWVYLLRRVLLLVPVLIGLATIIFAFTSGQPDSQRVAPYLEPATAPPTPTVPCTPTGGAIPVQCPNPAYEQAAATVGIGAPLPVQWALFVYHAFTGQWGHVNPYGFLAHDLGLRAETSVASLLTWESPYTMELLAVALLLTVFWTAVLGVPLTRGEARPGGRAARWAGYAAALFPALMTASLSLWLVMVLAGSPSCDVTGFGGWYGSWPPERCLPGGALPSWLSTSGRTTPTGIPVLDAMLNGEGFLAVDSIRRILLPAAALSLTVGLILLRRWESNETDRATDRAVLLQRRALGYGEPAVNRPYRRRVAASRTIREFSLTFSFLVGAIPIVEYIFHLRGLGTVLVDGLTRPQDIGCVPADLFLLSVVSILGVAFLDGLRAYLDPRVRDEPS